MSKIKWKRTKDGIEFIEKKTLAEKMQDISFMQMSMTLFVLQMVLLAGGILWSVLAKGHAPLSISALGFLIVVLGIAGIAVTVYGHFVVGAETKTDWKLGVLLNFLSVMVIVTFFLMGLIIQS